MTRILNKYLALAVVAALTTATAVLARETQSGDRSRWSLDFRVSLEQDAGLPVEVHLIGDWVSTVVAKRTGEYDAQLQIDHLSFTGDAVKGTPEASVEDLKRRLSRPFWATYRADGGLLEMHFFRDVSPADRNLLQMIATELQLVRPDSPQSSWTAQERDGAGEYLALYVMPQPDRIMKRKLEYIYTDGVAGAPASAIHVAMDESNLTFSLRPGGGIQAVDGISRMHLEMSPHSGKLAAVTEIHVGDFRSDHAPELIGSLAHASPDVTSSSIVTHKPDPEEALARADERLLKGHNTQSLLLAAFVKDANDSTLSDRLVALFRRRPEATAAAVALLSGKGAQKRVTDALAIAGSPSSVSALGKLARNAALPSNVRVDAVVAFVQMQHPTVEAMRVPGDLMDDSNSAVRSAARMMSGALARAGRPAHPAESDSIDSALICRYRNSEDTQQMIELLGALGNSAGPSVVPVIEEALRDSQAPVRAAAARALRLAPGPEVDRLLATVMDSDSSPVVRSDAIFAARFRHPLPTALADAVLQTATSDSVDYVRSDAIALIGQNPAASPSIPATLARIVDQDPNPGIRRQASKALASIHSPDLPKP